MLPSGLAGADLAPLARRVLRGCVSFGRWLPMPPASRLNSPARFSDIAYLVGRGHALTTPAIFRRKSRKPRALLSTVAELRRLSCL